MSSKSLQDLLGVELPVTGGPSEDLLDLRINIYPGVERYLPGWWNKPLPGVESGSSFDARNPKNQETKVASISPDHHPSNRNSGCQEVDWGVGLLWRVVCRGVFCVLGGLLGPVGVDELSGLFLVCLGFWSAGALWFFVCRDFWSCGGFGFVFWFAVLWGWGVFLC